MANTTNFGWETPDDTDLVKDGAAAIRTLGSAIDTSLGDLEGGTTGQILAKNSNSDMDFVWVTNDVGDITAVTAGTGISGGGTSGAVTITNSMATEIAAKGDLIVGTGSATFDNLAAGTNNHRLVAASGETTGLKYVADTQNTVIDAAGDLVYGTAADTLGRLAIGTAGQVLQVNSGATAPEWATPAAGGGGKVLQVIHSTTSTSTATTSTSFQDTTLTATITPTLATSKILILVSQNSCVRPSGNVDNSLGLQLLRGATSIAVFEKLLGYQGVSGTSLFLSTSTNYLDNPATTSATTYKTQFKSIVSGQSVTVQGDSATSTITLMEIGA
jgi:hypothetical protein